MNTLLPKLKNKTFHAGSKEKYQYPSLENFSLKTYALSINPIHSYNSFVENYVNLNDIILKPYFNEHAFYSLRPELSTKSIKWHVHGTLRFKTYMDILLFYKKIQDLKEVCTFTIIEIDSPIDWKMYCIKQRHIIKPYITRIYNADKKVSILPYKIHNLV